MKTLPLDVYSEVSNVAVITPPGRRFPGVVIQGDSLHGLVRVADELVGEARSNKNPDAVLRLARELRDALAGRLLHYQDVLVEHEHELPYGELYEASPTSDDDPAPTVAVEDWIFEENLELFLRGTGALIGESLDEDDVATVLAGVAPTDAEKGVWYDYELPSGAGHRSIRLRLAPDPGSSVIHVRAIVPTHLAACVAHSIVLLQMRRQR